jgi:hypothetical protein
LGQFWTIVFFQCKFDSFFLKFEKTRQIHDISELKRKPLELGKTQINNYCSQDFRASKLPMKGMGTGSAGLGGE